MTMMKNLMLAAAMLVAAPMAIPAVAVAQESPLVAGDYARVGGIYVKDGASLKYAMHLAGDWKKNQEFAKSQGWISGYSIWVNEHPREGEPNIYLMTTFASLPDTAEEQKRAKVYDAWAKDTIAQRQAESGNRAEYRTVKSSMLLREYKVR
jgi:opacity protein-like surface antigen